MKGQLIIRKLVQLLEEKDTENLVACHARPPALTADVLRYHLADRRMCIEKVGNDLEFFGMGHIEPRLGECRLFFVSLAHSWLAPFAVSGV